MNWVHDKIHFVNPYDPFVIKIRRLAEKDPSNVYIGASFALSTVPDLRWMTKGGFCAPL